tara:strand:- start:1552 stop:2037 length:486 start_codon:yes stop_codon:yes gene_type:complete
MLENNTFDSIIRKVIEHEGGYVNDPHDKGGETNFGISKRWFPDVDIKNLTEEQAVNIYYQNYWIPAKVDRLPDTLRSTYFDMCVNMGQKQAVKILQEAINSKKRTKIDVDGRIGPQTIESATKIGKRRLQAYRCKFYANLVKQDKSQERFYYGWFRRAIDV